LLLSLLDFFAASLRRTKELAAEDYYKKYPVGFGKLGVIILAQVETLRQVGIQLGNPNRSSKD